MVVFGGYAKGYDLVNDVWVLSLAGIPAWARLDPRGTPPSGRHLHSAIYDPVRNRVVIFGGYQRSEPVLLNDVWALSLGDHPTWERLVPVGAAPAAREGHTAIYDAKHDRMIVFGGYQYSGYRGATSGPLNDVWALSLSGSPAWSQLSPAGTLPAPRSAHSAIYDPMHHSMVVFGGFGRRFLNDAWELMLEGNPRWTEITPLGTTPPPRLAHAAIYDPAGRRMVMFDGSVNGSGPAAGDVWALSLTGRSEWSLITPAGAQPSARSGVSAIYDPMRLRAVIFGGTPDGFGLLSDVWGMTLAGGAVWANLTPPGTPPGRPASAIYDPVRDRMVALGGNGEVWVRSLAGSLTWTLLVAPGTPPNPRTVGSSIYDPRRDRIVVFGGSTDHLDSNNDAWALPLSGNPAWVQLRPTGGPPAVRESHTAIYDPARDRMVVYAGVNSQQYLGDVWALSLAGDPSWTRLAPMGAPPNSRLGHSAIYDPVRDRMIVFGGLNGVYFLNDVWELSFAGQLAWARLAPTGKLPPPSDAHTAFYDPVRDRMVVYGLPDDVWALSLGGNPAWTVLAPAGTAPGSGSPAMYDPPRDRMVVFGGAGDVWHLDWAPLSLPPTAPLSPPLSVGAETLTPVFAYPNPSRGEVTISYRLERTSEASLRIFDAAGRVMKTLVRGTLPAGPHSIRWDRRVDSGALAQPGVYIYELQADGHSSARRLVLVR